MLGEKARHQSGDRNVRPEGKPCAYVLDKKSGMERGGGVYVFPLERASWEVTGEMS